LQGLGSVAVIAPLAGARQQACQPVGSGDRLSSIATIAYGRTGKPFLEGLKKWLCRRPKCAPRISLAGRAFTIAYRQWRRSRQSSRGGIAAICDPFITFDRRKAATPRRFPNLISVAGILPLGTGRQRSTIQAARSRRDESYWCETRTRRPCSSPARVVPHASLGVLVNRNTLVVLLMRMPRLASFSWETRNLKRARRRLTEGFRTRASETSVAVSVVPTLLFTDRRFRWSLWPPTFDFRRAIFSRVCDCRRSHELRR